jgi:hypothetical protein
VLYINLKSLETSFNLNLGTVNKAQWNYPEIVTAKHATKPKRVIVYWENKIISVKFSHNIIMTLCLGSVRVLNNYR